MKLPLLVLLCSMPAFAQDGSAWVHTQWNDKLTGSAVVSYQLSPQSDGSGRHPYIGITCSQADHRFTYGYFTDDLVYINAEYSRVSTMYYPTTIRYRADANKPKTDSVTVRPDFRTINVDQGIMYALTGGGHEFAISYPSERGYQVTDVFVASPLPASYAADCYTEKMRWKQK